ncbi:hypothetical protein [Streptomyces goshikiensis]|uniref:hypothetical protein n=1 Tax=Streptomyces goshikiensis TaxID=1942 RepID=UPI003687F0DF
MLWTSAGCSSRVPASRQLNPRSRMCFHSWRPRTLTSRKILCGECKTTFTQEDTSS